MTGEVPDAGPYIEQMDVLVNASDPEPFGIVILEGMARGVAVVAVNSGGPGDFVRTARRACSPARAQPDALADALEPLLRSPELRERLGRAGRESYLEEFTDRRDVRPLLRRARKGSRGSPRLARLATHARGSAAAAPARLAAGAQQRAAQDPLERARVAQRADEVVLACAEAV